MTPEDDEQMKPPLGGPAQPPSSSRPVPAKSPTEDERLLEGTPELPLPSDVGDAWRVFRILGEFVEGFEEMNDVGPCVSIFGSARVSDADPMYWACVETAKQLGLSLIHI